MNLTHYPIQLTDDLSLIADGTESVTFFQPCSQTSTSVSGVAPGAIKTALHPSGNPCGVIVWERDFNAPKSSQNEKALRENDIIIDSQQVRWQIISIETKARIDRRIYHTRRIDPIPQSDAWLDILTPIYQTDEYGAAVLKTYRQDATGVAAKFNPAPVSSHRQFTDDSLARIEIIFVNNDIQISPRQRIRLPDGGIYRPTDIFPVTDNFPCLRLIAQKEAL